MPSSPRQRARPRAGSRPAPERPPLERVAAWVVTGPPGHLYSALADIAVAWARYTRALARRRGGGVS